MWHTLDDSLCELGESPFWHPDERSLYWLDIPGRAVLRTRGEIETAAVERWSLPAEPGCIAPARSGGLVIALRDGIYRARSWGGPLVRLAIADYDTRTLRFNDGKCDARGRFWAVVGIAAHGELPSVLTLRWRSRTDESPPWAGERGCRERWLVEPQPAQRADAFDTSHHPRAGSHQRHGLVIHQRAPVQLQDDPLLQPGRHRLNRVLPRTGGGTDHDRAAPTHKHFHVAEFVDDTRGPVDVVQPHFHACHQPVQAPQRPAQPVRGALLPQLTFKVVGSKVKLHDQGLEKLRQPDFGADAEPEKAASL